MFHFDDVQFCGNTIIYKRSVFQELPQNSRRGKEKKEISLTTVLNARRPIALLIKNNDINLSVIEDKFSIEHELSYVDLLRSTTKGASFARKRRLSSSPRKQGIGTNGATPETNPTIDLLREYNRELCNLLIHEYECDPQTHPLLKKYRGFELQNRMS